MLEELYEHEITDLVHVDESFIRGDAVTREDWRDFLGQKRYNHDFIKSAKIEPFQTQANCLRSYTVAYVDFFDEEIKRQAGDWREVLKSYLFSGSQPLINGYAGGRKSTIMLSRLSDLDI